MQSRMDKYYRSLEEQESSRSNKHSDLYKEIYGSSKKYDRLDIPENTNEIDISELRNMIHSRDDYQRLKEHEISRKTSVRRDVVDTPKEEPKIYNINELLEKARTEKNKLKEVQKQMIHTNYNLLKTLDLNEDEVLEEEKDKIRKHYEDLSKTREMRYAGELEELVEDLDEDYQKTNSSLPLDILSDLKPTGNTIVTKPIVEKKEDTNEVEKDLTKERTLIEEAEDFYSGAFKFNGKDFEAEIPKRRSGFTGFLLVIFIILLITALLLFIVNVLGINIIPRDVLPDLGSIF